MTKERKQDSFICSAASQRIVEQAFSYVEAHLQVALRPQVIDLIRPDLVQKVREVARVGEIPICVSQS